MRSVSWPLANRSRLEALEQREFLGELALSGQVRPVRGVLPAAIRCDEQEHSLILAEENAPEAGIVRNLAIYPVNHLLQLVAHLMGSEPVARSIRLTMTR